MNIFRDIFMQLKRNEASCIIIWQFILIGILFLMNMLKGFRKEGKGTMKKE